MSKLSRAPRDHRDLLLGAALFLVIAGCGGDGCGGCDTAPLPAGGLPADQTIEGGAQVRVTPGGFAKVEGLVGGLIDDALGDGVCLPEDSLNVLLGDFEFCFASSGSCTPGCRAGLSVDRVDLTPEPGEIRVNAQLDIQAAVPLRFDPLIGGTTDPCTLNVRANNTLIEAVITVGIDAGTGELALRLLDIPGFELTPSYSGCGFLGGLIDFVDGLFGIIEGIVADEVEGQLGALIEEGGLLPDPLGLEGVVDLGSALAGISPGTTASLETRLVPGGYASVEGGGLSLGLITGINADRDPGTRAPGLRSEPALCVPQLAAPDLNGSLPTSPRGNFQLPPADPFRGLPGDDSESDVVVGLSETFLDLAGHHAVTSGALCLGLGTQQIEQLTLGAIGLVAPSLAELGSVEGNDPILLLTRPRDVVDFEVGDGTEASPSLTLHVRGLQIDFYAFLFQRYVRGFTVSLDLDVGVNLEFATDDDGNPVILPVLSGLDADNLGVEVVNEEFLRESEAELELLLPTIVSVALPLLTDALPEIAVPEFLGFRLDGLRLAKVSTADDDFLAVSATLGASAALARLSEGRPDRIRSSPDLAAAAPAPAARATARGLARLVRVTTPPPEAIRAHLGGQGGAMPEVVIDVSARDPLGRELEWTWNLDGGMWRPFRPGGRLVVADRAFAIQGRYRIELRSRVAGDYTTLSTDTEVLPVVIDSVGPRILGERAKLEGDGVLVPAVDLVSPADRVEIAFARAGEAVPTTAWGSGRLPVALAEELAGTGSERAIQAWARDELGNQSSARVELGGLLPLGDQNSADAGCACRAGGGAEAAGGLVLCALAALVGLGRRRSRPGPAARPARPAGRWRASRPGARPARSAGRWRASRLRSRPGARPARSTGRHASRLGRIALLLVVGGALAAQPACSCSGNSGEDDGGASGPECTIDDDCSDECAGAVPFCADQQCVCEDEVRWGSIGQYSDMAVAPDGTAWVSAYNSLHGDLMVASTGEAGRIPDDAWQFVDGVPDGPVLVPDSSVRGGINAPGPDVGLYTDIAIAPDGVAMVSYFDRESGSLRFVSNRGGGWSTHVIDEGAPALGDGSPFEIAGQYSAITVRSDGRPGIAYFVHLTDGGGERTELRFAEASSADPRASADWAMSVLDGAAVADGSGDPLPIPVGVGLFASAARLADGSPVVVYYDRVQGDLKAARYDPAASAFLAPEVLAGAGAADVGWYPSVAVDAGDHLHVSYVSASDRDLLYLDGASGSIELIDDGYREVGSTEGGVPLPEFHFVGDDSGLVLGAGGPLVAYQDATSHELLLAYKDEAGAWQHETLVGNEDPFTGGYGFYVAAGLAGDELIISSWVIDQPNRAAWVEIVRDPTAVVD